MNTQPRPSWRSTCSLWLLGAAFTAASAVAAPGNGRTDIQQRLQQERATCLSGMSNQDRATCLREVAAAAMEARRGGLDGDAARLQANQISRCAPLPEAYRQDCIARMSGQGTAIGSAESGGIYRELVTREPAAPVKDAPAR